MKLPASFFAMMILFWGMSIGQDLPIEKVDWLNPKTFKARQLTFKTDSLTFEMKNCKIMEIRTSSGVTGYYVEGEGDISIPSKNLSELCYAAMLRFNPAEVDSLVSFDGLKETSDDTFINKSLHVLKSIFKHCYHSGMDAIIPATGYYAVNFMNNKLGDVLASRDKEEIIVFNFTLRAKM